MKLNIYIFSFLFIFFCLPHQAEAQQISKAVQLNISNYLTKIGTREIALKHPIKIKSARVIGKKVIITADDNCAYIPFREKNVAEIYHGVKELLPTKYAGYNVTIITNKRTIESLIPIPFRTKKTAENKLFAPAPTTPLVTNISKAYQPTLGLRNRHLAIWQSHGRYFNQQKQCWEWQRGRLFETVEDLYTQSYVLPFLVPMLENAGANVLLPRERDVNTSEVIIDNDEGVDKKSTYAETSGTEKWETGTGDGFAHIRDLYIEFENPFHEGTYRQVQTVSGGKESKAVWTPDIPKEGEYAVYVAYKTVPNSSKDALYSIYHKGGITQFKVNQQMGGGTWIYLGTFHFDQGKSDRAKIILSNTSSTPGTVVTADAVKIGGGVGNIARRAKKKKAADYITSGYPRFCEGARYWLQWAGAPDSIYSESQGDNDYSDDFKSRGHWVNYLAGGSSVLHKQDGLHIPINMAFALHSDAGLTDNDSIIGSLGIYQTSSWKGKYENGADRYLGHDLVDIIQTQVVNDIRKTYEPLWSRREMWNKMYHEARFPHVPTMLLELLSHQNFADMRYGLDPRFRFTVSRTIYKGMLQFLCWQYHQKYVVQPLPVDNFEIFMSGETEIELRWQPVNDPLEPTAKPEQYIVYKRLGNGAFDNGTLVGTNIYKISIPKDMICSFKVTAVNKGGESFPSEILSVGKATNSKGTVLVVNGFDRISAPADFVDPNDPDHAGFLDHEDHGVPYLKDISYTGKMNDFDRTSEFISNDNTGFGNSESDYETKVIAGNTFDYPALHGASILKAGYSFISCSNEAVSNKHVSLNNYKIVDLILGKQYRTKMGRGNVYPVEFATFDKGLQVAITNYVAQGGNIFVSGAFVASDLWNNRDIQPSMVDMQFTQNVLKYKLDKSNAAHNGQVKAEKSDYNLFNGTFTYYNTLNNQSYIVEAPDAITPTDKNSKVVLRYSENNLGAGIAYQGTYKTVVWGIPFESIREIENRNILMHNILKFFSAN